MEWTAKQKSAIENREKSLLVSAAAGSGKTAVLVERVRRLVMEEGVSLDRMLIVTFTNAAAAEMKQRIYKALNDKLKEPGQTRESQAWLRTQMGLVGRANISTFSKFALEIVHRYYHVIGIKPNLGICDEPRKAILMQEAMDELMERCYEEDDPDFRAFLDHYASSRGDRPVRTMVQELYGFLQSLPDPDAWTRHLLADVCGNAQRFRDFARAQACHRLDLAFGYFRKAAQELEGLPNLKEKNDEDMAFTASLLQMARDGDLPGALQYLRDRSRFTTMSAKKEEKEAWAELKPLVEYLRRKAKDHIKKARDSFLVYSDETLEKEQKMALPHLRTLLNLTERFSSLYGAKKSLLDLLDFSDIEHYALRILEDGRVREEYRSQFDYVFVDEYQDSNMVQETLIERVARGDNVFMVGDVKQSIYKFRLAEPELFLERSRRFKSGADPRGEVIDLNSNFRSKREVIDLVNLLFEQLMTVHTADMAYTEDERLVKGSPYEGPLSYPPVLTLIENALPDAMDGEDPSQDEEAAEQEDAGMDEEILDLRGAELEALNAVRQIRAYHGRPIYDDKEKRERPLQYRDMAILLRAVKGDGEVFYQTLLAAGIPVFLDRSEGYFDAVEIRVFMSLLRIIDNRSQDVPLLSVLRSPVFGFDAAELAAIRLWAKERGGVREAYSRIFSDYIREGPQGALREKCAAFAEKLDRWRELSRHLPLGDFLWQLLIDSGYASFAAAIPSGTQRLANLRALADKAQQYEDANASGLYGFIRYIDAINSDRKGKIELGQAKILSEGEDVVRIMTIHKSKGLEFPFVLLAGLAKRFNFSAKSQAAFHRDYGVALRLTDPARGIVSDPLSLTLMRAKKRAEEMAENVRILYVALTRPRDIVLMSAALEAPQDALQKAALAVPGDIEDCNSYLNAILPALPRRHVEVIARSALEKEAAGRKSGMQALQEKLERGFCVSQDDLPVEKSEIARRLNFCYEAAEPEREKRKYTVSQIAAMQRSGLHAAGKVLQQEGEEAFDDGDALRPKAKDSLPAFLSGEPRPDAASRGTAYHAVMEHLPFTAQDKDAQSIARFIDGLAERHLITPAQRIVVDPNRISAFFSSPIGREAVAAKELHKEASFTMRHELGGREVLVQGTIDCYFRTDDGWVLLDYKSNYIDRAHEEEEMQRMREEYLPQLALYREALEGITRTPVTKAVLYLFGVDKEVVIS